MQEKGFKALYCWLPQFFYTESFSVHSFTHQRLLIQRCTLAFWTVFLQFTLWEIRSWDSLSYHRMKGRWGQVGSPVEVTRVFWVGTKGVVLVGAGHNCILSQTFNSIQLILKKIKETQWKAVDFMTNFSLFKSWTFPFLPLHHLPTWIGHSVFMNSTYYTIPEWSRLEGTLKTIEFHPRAMGRDTFH